MNEIQSWFEEAEKVTLVFDVIGEKFIIYKGFKLSRDGDRYIIEDTRFSNFYGPVTKSSLKEFRDHGFIKGADIISFHRNTKRVASYKRKTELLYDRRAKFKKELPKDRRLNEKRIRNINKRISDYVDQMFLFKNRITDFNNKYKDYENTIGVA